MRYTNYTNITSLIRDMQYCFVCKKNSACRVELYLTGSRYSTAIHYNIEDMIVAIRSNNSNPIFNLDGNTITNDLPSSFCLNDSYPLPDYLNDDDYFLNIGATCECDLYSRGKAYIIDGKIRNIGQQYSCKYFEYDSVLYRINYHHNIDKLHIEINGENLFKFSYFELDFTNIPKLVNKINTLITFS